MFLSKFFKSFFILVTLLYSFPLFAQEKATDILFRSEIGIYSTKIKQTYETSDAAIEGEGSIVYSSLSVGVNNKTFGLYIGFETGHGSNIDVKIDGQTLDEHTFFYQAIYKYGALFYLTPNISISPELRRVADQNFSGISTEADGFGFGLRLAHEWLESKKFKFGVALSFVTDKSKSKYDNGSTGTLNVASTSNYIGVSFITTYF